MEPKIKKVKTGYVETTTETKAVAPKKAKVAFMFFMKERAPVVMKENNLKSCAGAAKLLG